jgi:hypothetical protein
MKKQSQTIKTARPPGVGGPTTVAGLTKHPTGAEIPQRARGIHLARGGEGHPLLARLQAEDELKSKSGRHKENKAAEPAKSLSY